MKIASMDCNLPRDKEQLMKEIKYLEVTRQKENQRKNTSQELYLFKAQYTTYGCMREI
jgi:hypothetical protein